MSEMTDYVKRVWEMRKLQKQYFQLSYACKKDASLHDKRKEVLEKSKAAEMMVDAMTLRLMKEEEQPSLFGQENINAQS